MQRLVQARAVERVVMQTERPPKQPVTKELLRAVMRDSEIDQAVRTAVLFGYHGMLRVEEYTAASRVRVDKDWTLLRRDVVFDDQEDAISVRIKKSKSDPAFQGPQFSITASGGVYCPVQAIRSYTAWFDTRFGPDEPLFRHANRSFVTRIDIDRALKKHATAVMGISPYDISTHGLRYGGAFEMADAYVRRGCPIDWGTIIARGRWHGQSAEMLAEHYARFSVARAQMADRALSLDDNHSARVFRRRF